MTQKNQWLVLMLVVSYDPLVRTMELRYFKECCRDHIEVYFKEPAVFEPQMEKIGKYRMFLKKVLHKGEKKCKKRFWNHDF